MVCRSPMIEAAGARVRVAASGSRSRRWRLRCVRASMLVAFLCAATGAQGQGLGDSTTVTSHSVVWRLDAAVQRSAQATRAAQGETAATVTKLMNGWGGTGVVVFAALLWLGGRFLGAPTVARVGLRGTEALAIASGVSGIIKGLAGRARPFLMPGEPWHWDFNHGWSDARYFSMPSGHTTATMAFAVAVCIAAWRVWRWPGLLFGMLAIGSALAVAASRVYTDQHWLSDVVVGSILGAGVAIALARVFRDRAAAATYHRVMLGRRSGPTAGTIALLLVGAVAPLRDLGGQETTTRGHHGPVLTKADARVLILSLAGSMALVGSDERIMRWTQSSTLQRSGPFRSSLDAASHMGGPTAILVAGGMWATGSLTGSRTIALVGRRSSEAILLSGAVTAALKGVTGRSRPDHPPARASNFAFGRGITDDRGYDSFPSGHTTVAFALASAVDAEWGRLAPDGRPRWVGPALYAMASLTAASRVFDERHWASDVVLGAAIGFVGGRAVVRWRADQP